MREITISEVAMGLLALGALILILKMRYDELYKGSRK